MPLATWTNETVAGAGWLMNQEYITMNGLIDPIQGLTVYMNGLGTATVWTNENI